MADYQRLDPAKHSDFRIDEEQRTALFAERHMVNIELKEVVQAAADFPLFISKISDSSQWAVSALCGLAPPRMFFFTIISGWRNTRR
ncbi:SapC family protein [Salinimonas marina]|uniref:SapC family protein n=1 Tax=Salinimonas marina TaxID=2785918 RepID=A0A7S9DZB5_9ALTE|nr:SapC family protein [Salinimonas marina]QPG06716.1 SapC family protein [Salinimonas marina]